MGSLLTDYAYCLPLALCPIAKFQLGKYSLPRHFIPSNINAPARKKTAFYAVFLATHGIQWRPFDSRYYIF